MSRRPSAFYMNCTSCCYYKLFLFLWITCLLPALLINASPAYRGNYFDSKCTDVETGRELFVGEAFTRPGRCIRLQCLGTLQLWEDRCQIPKLEGNCHSVPPANEFLNYPHCCPLYTCEIHVINGVSETEETRTYDQYGSLQRTHISQVFSVSPVKGSVPGSGVYTQFEI
ncbi:protein Vago [Eurosta solidaginis]|uniref:protein Vago n=1 Tax=Eurosta solidaginis TaxID=178769 RepID=UPI0035305CFC